jgi:hypothetical protein
MISTLKLKLRPQCGSKRGPALMRGNAAAARGRGGPGGRLHDPVVEDAPRYSWTLISVPSARRRGAAALASTRKEVACATEDLHGRETSEVGVYRADFRVINGSAACIPEPRLAQSVDAEHRVGTVDLGRQRAAQHQVGPGREQRQPGGLSLAVVPKHCATVRASAPPVAGTRRGTTRRAGSPSSW